MSVRKRTWTTSKGEPKEAWVVTYTDAAGSRIQKTFHLQKEARAWHAATVVAIKHGTHVPDSKSVTVKEAGELWLETAAKNQLERATIAHYREHLALHIAPHFGVRTWLSQLSPPMVRAFEDAVARKASPITARKVLGALGAILADAHERGLVAHNVVRELRSKRHGKEQRAERRRHGKLKVGVDIPTPAEIKATITARITRLAAEGRPQVSIEDGGKIAVVFSRPPTGYCEADLVAHGGT
jgi:integrase